MLKKRETLSEKSYFHSLAWSYGVVFFVLFLIYAVNCSITMNVVKKGYEENTVLFLENARDDIDHRIIQINQLANLIIANDDMINGISSEHTSDFVYSDYECMEYLRNVGITSDIVDEIFIYNKKRDRVISSLTAQPSYEYFNVRHAEGGYTFEEWKSLLEDTRGKKFVMLPKKSIANNAKNDTDNNYLAYVQALPIGVEYEKELTLVILINVSRLTVNMGMLDENDSGQFTVFDKNGMTIVSVGNIASAEELKTLENGQYKFDGSMYSVNVVESKTVSWRYVIVTPQKAYVGGKRVFNVVTLICMVLYIVCGIAMMYNFSKSNYRPLQRIMNTLRINVNTKYGGNEFRVIARNVENMRKEYESLLRSNRKHIIQQRDKYFKSILEGGKSVRSMLDKETMQKYSFEPISDYFSVMCIRIENINAVMELMDMQTDMAQYAISNVVTELFEANQNKCFTCAMSVDTLAVIVNFNENVTDRHRCIEDVIRNFDNFFAENYQMELFVSVSGTGGSAYDLANCYHEAQFAAKYRIVVGRHKTVFYEDIEDKSLDYVYTMDSEREIAAALNGGDFERAEKVINELFDENVYSNRCAVIAIQSFIFELERTLMKLMPSSMVMDITELETNTASEIQQRILERISEYCNMQTNKGRLYIGDSVKKYIEENYADSNLSVNALGEFFGLAPSYLSKLFREQTNANLLNYIHEVRIKHAEELLSNGVSVEKAAERVGYTSSNSFTRVYKKMRGITPGQYRRGGKQ